MLDTIMTTAESYGAVGLFLCLVLCSFGLPIAKSLVIVAGGILAGAGQTHPMVLFLACSLGLHGGDFILFLLGRHYGDAVFESKWLRRIAPLHQVDRAKKFIARYGAASILMARITPFIRSLCYLSLGSLRMRPSRFFIMNFGVAMIYSSVFFMIGFFIGNHPDRLNSLIRSGNIIFVFAALAVITALFLYKRPFPARATMDLTDDDKGMD